MQNAAPQTFNTRDELRMVAGDSKVQVSLLDLITEGDGNGGEYSWKPISTVADDGFLVLAVTGVATGRWHRTGNGNTIKGTVSYVATGLTASYTVTFPTVMPFVPTQVHIQARTAGAGNNFVPKTGITNAGFTVTFNVLPLLGVDITFDWLVIKQ